MKLETTPTRNAIPFRPANFANLAEALDYAGDGETGFNFFSSRGQLSASIRYRELRGESRNLARRLAGLGLERGSRILIVADTTPDFPRFFFACQYAGLVPVPVPIPLSLSSRKAYVEVLRGMAQRSDAAAAVAAADYLPLVEEAVSGLAMSWVGSPELFDARPQSFAPLRASDGSELAYIQFTSGSTRFPRGVMISQSTVMNNLSGIVCEGVQIRAGDRAVSWLPFYHDMGLVGLMLAPVASQLSVDFLGTRDFAVRPHQWLRIMSQTGGTISFSPPFGFELCTRRLRPGEAEALNLSSWRVAGVGAETINAAVLEHFAEAVAPSGFDPKAFTPCYGMAECSLAVSFNPLGRGVRVDDVNAEILATSGRAEPAKETARGTTRFVDSGLPLQEYEVEIRDRNGRALPDRQIGQILLRGPSIMSGYLGDDQATQDVLSTDGWLDTGDLGYRVDGHLFVTGRSKDMIIVNGRNVWPQDLEYLAHQQPEIRSGDCLAFSAPGEDGKDRAVMVVQSRDDDPCSREELVERLETLVRREIGIDCQVHLVPLHTLPRTSSGKLSRSKARQTFMADQAYDVHASEEKAGRDREDAA